MSAAPDELFGSLAPEPAWKQLAACARCGNAVGNDAMRGAVLIRGGRFVCFRLCPECEGVVRAKKSEQRHLMDVAERMSLTIFEPGGRT